MVAYLRSDTAFLVSVWLETVMYGLFLPIFAASIYALWLKQRWLTSANLPMFISAILMFALATVHVGVDTWRMIQAYIYENETPGGAAAFMYSLVEPTQSVKDAVYVTQSLLGDLFNIYRSWLVWNRNNWIPVFPLALWVAAAVIGYYMTTHLFPTSNPDSIAFDHLYKTYISVWYSLSLGLNLITTSLIAFRLWHHEQQIAAFRANGLSLLPILLIVVESAAIYLAALFVALILVVIDDTASFIMLEMLTPVIGIVFCLVIIRTSVLSYKARAISPVPMSVQSSKGQGVTISSSTVIATDV